MEKPRIICGLGRTKQSCKDECDINKIMSRYRKTGVLPVSEAGKVGVYGDFSTAEDYQASCNKVLIAQSQFALLPAELRARLNNDPAEFLRWVADPANKSEMEKLGMLKPLPNPPSPEPKKEEVKPPNG